MIVINLCRLLDILEYAYLLFTPTNSIISGTQEAKTAYCFSIIFKIRKEEDIFKNKFIEKLTKNCKIILKY